MASKPQFDALLTTEDVAGKAALHQMALGASPAYSRSARIWSYGEAIKLWTTARDAALELASLWPSAEGCSTANACEYAYNEQKQIASWGAPYQPAAAQARAAQYAAQIDSALAKRKALTPVVVGPIQPRPNPVPGPDDGLGGTYPDDPVAPPPDGQTQLGLVAAAGLILYAGYELLRRAASTRTRTRRT